jgi:hypothetical protein
MVVHRDLRLIGPSLSPAVRSGAGQRHWPATADTPSVRANTRLCHIDLNRQRNRMSRSLLGA